MAWQPVLEALKLLAVGGIGGTVASCIGKLFVDRKLQAQKHEHDRQIESLKSKLGKKDTIHKLQFEKEFQLYEELWKALFDLRSKVIITPTCDSRPKGKSKLEEYKDRYDAVLPAFNKAKNLFNDHCPFCHADVSKITKNLISQCRRYIFDVGRMLRSGEDDANLFDKADKLFKKTTDAIDEIEKAIQKRIGILQEAKIVD